MKHQLLKLLKPTSTYLVACLLGLGAVLTGCEIYGEEVLPLEINADAKVGAAKKQDKMQLSHQELAKLRATVARYHNIKNALTDGYELEFTGYRSQMGFHYLKPPLLDDQFEPELPEVLIYVPAPNGGLRFVGVEYATLIPDMDNPPAAPEGFSGSADVWAINTEFEVWTLHVWVGLNNPNGIFAPQNPRLP